jgi:signal transduction histidine kinase
MNTMTPITTLVGTIMKKLWRKDTNTTIEPKEVTPEIMQRTVKGLDLIDSRGKGLIHFVQNYRSITKLPKPEFQIVNVKNLLQKSVQLFEHQVSETNVELRVICHPSLFINADGSLLEQVLINLTKNAIESLDGVEHPIVTLEASSSNDQVLIQVFDNGQGIPPDMIDDIFVPFFTTKQKGSGIGLSLSRQIVHLHGGSLTVQSVPGNTVFTIRI